MGGKEVANAGVVSSLWPVLICVTMLGFSL